MNFVYRHRVAFGALALILTVAFTLGVCFFALAGTTAEANRLTVVLDAGHGGVDGGVVGTKTGVKESDINLKITYLVKERFEEAGFAVVLTRRTEAGLYGMATAGYKKRDMQRRAEIIQSSSPALVVSVHQNFFSLTSRRGAQVFFKESSESSQALACSIQAALNRMPECVKRSDPLKGDYFILNSSPAPAVIVECGFLSNPEDEALLLSENYQRKLAEAVVSGAIGFLSSSANLRDFG